MVEEKSLANCFRGSFAFSFREFMDKQVITISEDIINNVVKPMSLFLNDVNVGDVFTHIPQQGIKEYSIVDKRQPTYKFACSAGGTYKFTTFDLRNFSHDDVRFNDYFIPQTGKKCILKLTFKVQKCEPLLIDGQKVYPLFCYKGFEDFTAEKARLAENTYPTEEMYAELKASGIKSGSESKYYRTIDIDNPIFYYD